MYILGIHDGHNSAACLLKDGKLVFAIQEERLTGIKNYWGHPLKAIDACLKHEGITWAQVDHVAFAAFDGSSPGRPFISRDEYLEYTKHVLKPAPRAGLRARLRSVLRPAKAVAVPDRLSFYPPEIAAKGNAVEKIRHHLCHVATAAFGSNIGDGHDLLIVTVDGLGDGECATVNVLRADGQIEPQLSVHQAHSFAQIYAFVTVYLGFVHLEHEYKLMGMAPYGRDRDAERLADKLEGLFTYTDARWELKTPVWNLNSDERLVYESLREMFEFERFDNICAGLQLFSERFIVRFIQDWIRKTGVRRVAVSGGFFMNVKANQKLRSLPEIEQLFVYPSCGDETNAMGAAYLKYFQLTGKRPEPLKNFTLGPVIDDSTLLDVLKSYGEKIRFEYCEDIEERAADLLSKKNIVARVKGPEEFGARALGNRSILAHPSDTLAVRTINDMIKSRDFWMPFACSILEEEKLRYLKDWTANFSPNYMTMTYDSKNSEEILAGMHPRDRTVRPQVVTREQNADYHRLLSRFHDMTGIGGVLNTSYNLHGFPLVHDASAAIEVFLNSGLEYLALNQYLVTKPR